MGTNKDYWNDHREYKDKKREERIWCPKCGYRKLYYTQECECGYVRPSKKDEEAAIRAGGEG